jgi:hypothetical protein
MEKPTLQGFLAVLLTLAVMGTTALFMVRPPDATNQIVTAMISTELTVFVMVFQFYFGSSSGSKDKDDTIGKIASGAAPSTGNGAVATEKTTTITSAATPPAAPPVAPVVAPGPSPAAVPPTPAVAPAPRPVQSVDLSRS